MDSLELKFTRNAFLGFGDTAMAGDTRKVPLAFALVLIAQGCAVRVDRAPGVTLAPPKRRHR